MALIEASDSGVLIQNSDISSNTVGQNGVLFIQNSDSIQVLNSVIGSNVGEISSVLTSHYSNANFDACEIRDNYAIDQTIQALGSEMKFNRTTFDGNLGPLISNGF